MQFCSPLIFLFPFLYYASLCMYEFVKGEGKYVLNVWAALQFFSWITMAGHSRREGMKELKDYQHFCHSLASWHKALGRSGAVAHQL